ncbi:MAG: hypothetical protein Q7U38_04035 [Methylobacter sp.]|nr:hypothetical protein [Methylobacter sp.]MDP2100243.1 hypothetical protein [Methylobacter sp.]MDP2426861.1 hypothetical protein [Methylobacter sp.]MDP3053579.1 hypothetical protein [Methylobacter sp.]MDP3360851.1 hypothetical protein [Methylobacter sp.]
MQTSEQFKQLITLYRLLDRPALEGNMFQTEATCSPDLRNLLRALWLSKKYTIELTVDGKNISTEMEDDFPELKENQSLSIKLTIPRNDKGFFYKNISEWVALAGSLKKGRIAPNTYLADEDLIVNDEQGNTEVAKVKQICQLIEQLNEVAHYHDDKQGTNAAYRLVFVVPDKDDKVYRPVILETQLTEDILRAEQPDISLLCNILQEHHTGGNNIHAIERLSVYRIALAEIIEKIPKDTKAFPYLVKHWPDVTESFNKSWERYLSGFSFNKLKTEMAKQQIEFSQKLSDIVASLSGRLFSLPISIAGIVLLEKANSSLANWAYLLGSLLVSYMVFSAIKIQQENLENAKASYAMVFSEIDKEINEKNSSIQDELRKVKDRLSTTFSKLKCKLAFYSFIAWLPLLVAIIYIIVKDDQLILQIIEQLHRNKNDV